MPTRFVLAPVGAGKTEVALQKIADTLDEQPFARIWALLASKRQEDAFRQRLIEYQPTRKIYFNVEFFNFYELYQRLLDWDGQPQRELNDTARYGVLRTVVGELCQEGALPTFGGIATTPGFLRIVADFIYELKQLLITPEVFLEKGWTIKDAELGLIYQRYQQRLIHYRLVDREGQGWLAINALRDNDRLAGDLHLLIVDGFDQFTVVQADLLSLLADRAVETLITLTTVPRREKREGRRFSNTLDRLHERFPPQQVETQILTQPDKDRHADLQHLVDHIFLPAAPTVLSSGGLCFIETPDQASETAAVLRRVKQLLLTGCPPDEILIALRDWPGYQAHIATYGRAYGLPLVPHYGDPIAQNPAVVALLNVIRLHEKDFQRRDVLDALRSPYLFAPGLTTKAVRDMERISTEYAVVSGRSAWLNAIQQAAQPRYDDSESAEADPLITAEAADLLRADLEDFFDAMTPPAAATISTYVLWLERLIGVDPEDTRFDTDDAGGMNIEMGGYTLDLLARLREPSAGETHIARDLIALQMLKRVLRGLLSATELLRALDGSPADDPVTWAAFSADFLAAVGKAVSEARPNRSGRVLVTTASDARGLPHKHVFILGMAEGIFPKPIPEDPLYLDSERLALKARGIPLLSQAERAADDGLFYELICLPRESLTLSRPTTQNGTPWIESHLWRAVAALFSDHADLIAKSRLGIGQVVAPVDGAVPDEVAVGMSAALSRPLPLQDTVRSVYQWLVAQSPDWARIVRMRSIEAGRMSTDPHNTYSGRLEHALVVSRAAERFAPGRTWSASQLNDYGVCGFRYFAKRLLKIEALEDPEEGMDAAQRGSLNHAILEKVYARIQEEGLRIAPPNLDRALALLVEVADDVFQTAPRQFGFRESALWKQEQRVLFRKLEALIRNDFSDKSPPVKGFDQAERQPYRLEMPFGMDDRPVILPLDDGTHLHVRGYIDRVDRLGQQALIIDYKTGSSKIPREEISGGRNFQMMIYLLAAHQLLQADPAAPQEIAGGVFWHVASGEISPVLRWDDPDHQAILAQGRAHITRYMEQGRSGDYAAEANQLQEGKCIRYCEYSKLCRMSMMNRRKRPQP